MSIHIVPFLHTHNLTERCQYLILNYTYMCTCTLYTCTCLHHVSYNVVHVLYIHVYACTCTCICLGYHLHVHVHVQVNLDIYVGAFYYKNVYIIYLAIIIGNKGAKINLPAR